MCVVCLYCWQLTQSDVWANRINLLVKHSINAGQLIVASSLWSNKKRGSYSKKCEFSENSPPFY